MSKVENFTISSEHDGLALSVATVAPEGEPKALVQFSHGMAEHKERYLPVMEFLAEHGYACIVNDHRGHGASVRDPGDLGYFYKDGGRGLIKDMHQVAKLFRAKYPGRPLFLFGHSMGSLAARAYAAKYGREIDGLIVCGSPGLNPQAKAALGITRVLQIVHGGSRAHSRLMDQLTLSGMSRRFRGGSKYAWLSANAENVARYEADPLCGFRFTINGYRALLNLMLAAYDPRNSLRRSLPVHFMSGEDDPCAPDRAGFDTAVENIRARGCTEVTAKMYPGLRHEILNEGSMEVWNDLLRKLDEWSERKQK